MAKISMSVMEMGKSLGLKKTESYWLVHKNYFETRIVAGKMRVMVDSFEIKFFKINRFRSTIFIYHNYRNIRI